VSNTPYQSSESVPEPPPVQKFFTRSNWKVIVAVVVVILVVSLVLNVLVYTQPWSKVVVQVDNTLDGQKLVVMGVDNRPAATSGIRQEIWNSSNIDGVWTFHVAQGNHLLWVAAEGVNDTFFMPVKVGPLSQTTVRLVISWYAIELVS